MNADIYRCVDDIVLTPRRNVGGFSIAFTLYRRKDKGRRVAGRARLPLDTKPFVTMRFLFTGYAREAGRVKRKEIGRRKTNEIIKGDRNVRG